jgi:predicted P-loop ATPase
MAYDRTVTEVQRQFIIVGTTNSAQYLQDVTGNRRFWPGRIQRFDLDALKRDRDQIWAEAAALETKGASIRLEPKLWVEASAQQEARVAEDPYLNTLAAALGDRQGKIPTKTIFDWLEIPEGNAIARYFLSIYFHLI